MNSIGKIHEAKGKSWVKDERFLTVNADIRQKFVIWIRRLLRMSREIVSRIRVVKIPAIALAIA